MADRDSVTVVGPASMSSAYRTKAVGADDEDGFTRSVPVMLVDSVTVVGPSLAHLAQKQSAQTMKTD